MKIAIDFDGTCVSHQYPSIGKDIGAIPVLKALAAEGHELMLWTMRHGSDLQDACDWFTENGIPISCANVNADQVKWTLSPKLYASLYIDDAALGIPLIRDFTEPRHYVDWKKVRAFLVKNGYLPSM